MAQDATLNYFLMLELKPQDKNMESSIVKSNILQFVLRMALYQFIIASLFNNGKLASFLLLVIEIFCLVV
jgi:hypothetical protein